MESYLKHLIEGDPLLKNVFGGSFLNWSFYSTFSASSLVSDVSVSLTSEIFETSSGSYLYFIPKMTKWNRQNYIKNSFVILRVYVGLWLTWFPFRTSTTSWWHCCPTWGPWPSAARTSFTSSTCRAMRPTPPSSWRCCTQRKDHNSDWVGSSGYSFVTLSKYSFLGQVKMSRCLGRLTIFEERLFYFEREHERVFQNIVILEWKEKTLEHRNKQQFFRVLLNQGPRTEKILYTTL